RCNEEPRCPVWKGFAILSERIYRSR
ncbi:uncharacterized, partial [Tachysurus ichikawai]